MTAKTIVQRDWTLSKLRNWLYKQGVTQMPQMWSVYDCENTNNPMNGYRFKLGDSRTERLIAVAAVIRRNGGYARIDFNEQSTKWSYLVIDMKGDVIR